MRIRIQIYKTAVGILNLEEEKPNISGGPDSDKLFTSGHPVE